MKIVNSIQEVMTFLQEKLPDRMILSNPGHKNMLYRKITITKMMMKDVPRYQAEKFTATQVMY